MVLFEVSKMYHHHHHDTVTPLFDPLGNDVCMYLSTVIWDVCIMIAVSSMEIWVNIICYIMKDNSISLMFHRSVRPSLTSLVIYPCLSLAHWLALPSVCGSHKCTYIHIHISIQSVEHDHPHALDFLRKDCQNINDFFQKKVWMYARDTDWLAEWGMMMIMLNYVYLPTYIIIRPGYPCDWYKTNLWFHYG